MTWSPWSSSSSNNNAERRQSIEQRVEQRSKEVSGNIADQIQALRASEASKTSDVSHTNETTASLLSQLTQPSSLVPSLVLTTSFLLLYRLYTLYLRRIPAAAAIRPSFWRRRSLLGWATSVGDGDGLRLFHTPGGRLAGWGWLPGRRSWPIGRGALKGQTISIRLAGVDAPESPHFGQPGQPGGVEAKNWLERYVKGRRVRAYVWRRDQYERAVATVHRLSWGGLIRRDVGLVMLKKGLATVYEAKTGLEFGGMEKKYRRAEAWAKRWRRGIWGNKKGETPREFKDRMKAAGA